MSGLLNLTAPPRVSVSLASALSVPRGGGDVTVTFAPGTHAGLAATLAAYASAQVVSASASVVLAPREGSSVCAGWVTAGTLTTSAAVLPSPFSAVAYATDDSPASLSLPLPASHGFGREIRAVNTLLALPQFSLIVSHSGTQGDHVGTLSLRLELEVGGLAPYITATL